MTLEELKVIISAELEPYRRQVEQIRKITKEATKDMEEQVSKVRAAYTKVGEEAKKAAGVDLKTSGNKEATKAVEQWKNATNLIKGMVKDLGSGDLMKGAASGMKSYIEQANFAAGVTVYTDEYKQLETDIRATSASLEQLREKQEQFGDKKFAPTEEYRELEKCIEKAQRSLDTLMQRQESMESSGTKKSSKSWKSLQYRIEEARNTLREFQNDKEHLESSNGHLELSDEWKRVQLEIDKATRQLGHYRMQKAMLNAYGTNTTFADGKSSGHLFKTLGATAAYTKNEVVEKMRSINARTKECIKNIPIIGRVAIGASHIASRGFQGMLSVLNKVGPAIKGVSGVIGSLIQRFKNGNPHLKQAGNNLNGMSQYGKGLGGMFRTIGMTARFMFASFLIMGTMSGIKEGMQNLARYSKETNQSLSMLMSSLTQLKNSLATAFAPILTVVAPILNGFIQQLIRAITAIGHFFAALTGQKTFTVATKVQQDYAASLDESKASAEGLSKSLMGFDRINNITSNSGGGGASGGLSPGDMFETVEVDSKYKDLADKVKQYFAEIFKPMKNAWDTYGAGVIAAWERGLKSITELIKSIGDAFKEVWTNGTGEELCGNLLNLLTLVLNIIGDIADAFKKAWNEDNKGTKLIQSILDMFNAILGLIIEIGKSFQTVWNNGTGVEIIGHILEIFTNISNIIENIAANFKKAWSKDNTGTEIIQNLADILNIVLETIENITAGLEEWSKDLDFEPLLKGFKDLTEALKPLAEKVGEGLEWLFEEVLQPLGKWALESAIPATLNTISDALGTVNAVIEKLKPPLKWLWDNVLSGLWENNLKSISNWIEKLGDAFESVTTWLEKPSWGGFKNMILEISEAFFNNPLSPTNSLIAKALEHITGFNLNEWYEENIEPWLSKETWEETFSDLEESVSTWKDKMFKWFGDVKGKFSKKGKDTVEGIKKGWTDVKPQFETWLSNKPAEIVKGFGNIKSKFVIKGNNIIDGIKKGWNDIWKDFSAWLSGKPSDIVTKFGNIKDKFLSKGLDIISGIKKGWNDNWKDFSDWLGGIPEKISKGIGSLKSLGKSLIEDFIEGFTSLKLPKINLKVTYNAEGFGAKVWQAMGYKGAPNIKLDFSKYAQGGFPSIGEMFIAREAGPEMVGTMGRRSVVANNSQIVEGIKQGVYEAVMRAMAHGNDEDSMYRAIKRAMSEGLIKAVIDGDSAYRNVVQKNQQTTNRTGKNLLLT